MSKKKKTHQPKENRHRVGDCNPAQIVHFPVTSPARRCTTALFKKAGLSKRECFRHQILGIPLVDVHASFMRRRGFQMLVVVIRDHRMAEEQFFRPPPVFTGKGRRWNVSRPECGPRILDQQKRLRADPCPRRWIKKFSGDAQASRGRKKSRRKTQ